MLGKVVLVALVAVLAMAEVKHGWVLRRAGLLGSCVVYSTASNGTQWEVCKAGTLTGRPDLGSNGCTSQSRYSTLEYWDCPAPIVSAPTGF